MQKMKKIADQGTLLESLEGVILKMSSVCNAKFESKGQEMAWRQIGAVPFLAEMLISNRLEHEEQLSVKYFVLFAHCTSKTQIRHTF